MKLLLEDMSADRIPFADGQKQKTLDATVPLSSRRCHPGYSSAGHLGATWMDRSLLARLVLQVAEEGLQSFG